MLCISGEEGGLRFALVLNEGIKDFFTVGKCETLSKIIYMLTL